MFLVYGLLLVLAALILLVDLVTGAALAVALARAVPLAFGGAETTGHVVRVESRRPGRQARVRVAYETPRGMFETTGTSQRPRVGEPVPVRYDPVRPARATTLLRPARLAALGIPMVLVIAALCAGMITGGAWYFAGVHSQTRLPLAGGCLALALGLALAYYAWGQYAELLRWRRVVQTEGKVPATVRTAADVRAHAIGGTVLALIMIAIAVVAISLL